jgi:hypothetical protein
VVDDAHGVITAVHTKTGRINESHELMELIDQHQANTAIAAQTIVADCKYGTIENYIVCQKRKLRTHMADLLGSSPGSWSALMDSIPKQMEPPICQYWGGLAKWARAFHPEKRSKIRLERV